MLPFRGAHYMFDSPLVGTGRLGSEDNLAQRTWIIGMETAFAQNNPEFLLVFPLLGFYKQILPGNHRYLLCVKPVTEFVWVSAAILPRLYKFADFLDQG